MATIINEMLENIIGYTAADLASELGDAFFEAAKQERMRWRHGAKGQ